MATRWTALQKRNLHVPPELCSNQEEHEQVNHDLSILMNLVSHHYHIRGFTLIVNQYVSKLFLNQHNLTSSTSCFRPKYHPVLPTLNQRHPDLPVDSLLAGDSFSYVTSEPDYLPAKNQDHRWQYFFGFSVSYWLASQGSYCTQGSRARFPVGDPGFRITLPLSPFIIFCITTLGLSYPFQNVNGVDRRNTKFLSTW